MNHSEINILVVDDDDMLRQMIADVFEDEGYLVDTAENGVVALDLMQKKTYQILFTDMYMPELNGVDLILKCQQTYPLTKAILCSGGGRNVEAEHQGTQVKYNDVSIDIGVFLKKPCHINELLSAIENLLKQ